MCANWTETNIPNLNGKVMIVTGANIGLGFETAKVFARNAATVILACRNIDKGHAARQEMLREAPSADVEVMQLDLSSLHSVHKFAEAFKSKYAHLDVLVNNAGISLVPYGITENGFERHFAVNHLGHFALTGLLLDTLLATSNSRVVSVSSIGHRMGTMNFDNLMYEDGKDYSPLGAYNRSKLANLIFAYELQRRLEGTGHNTISIAAHPGSSNTNLGSHISDGASLWGILYRMMMSTTQSPIMGALPQIRAAVDPLITGGQYVGPSGFMQMRGYPVVVNSNDASRNEDNARKLWDISVSLTKITYDGLEQEPVIEHVLG